MHELSTTCLLLAGLAQSCGTPSATIASLALGLLHLTKDRKHD